MAFSGSQNTRLGVGGPSRLTGSFAGKAEGGSRPTITRVGLGGPSRLTGSFAGKAPSGGGLVFPVFAERGIHSTIHGVA